LKNCPSSDYSL